MYRISRLHLAISLIACFGIAQFVCSVALAIKRYPGDAAAAGGGGGYAMWGSFLSDLGKSKTASGVDNTASATISVSVERAAVARGLHRAEEDGLSAQPTVVSCLPTTITMSGKSVRDDSRHTTPHASCHRSW
jgi:hypothetical protein